MELLINEGDVNRTTLRMEWENSHKGIAKTLLEEDATGFLHQSLSSPCLDVIDRAEGIYLYAKSGRTYMDFHGNNVHQVGHANPFVLDKVRKQMDKLCFCPRRFTNQAAIDCAKALTQGMPSDLNRVLFAPAGTLAIGMALKIARIVTGKHKVISVWDSFHGASLDAISVGGEAQFQAHMGALLPGVEHIPPFMHSGGVFSSENELLYADYLEYVIRKSGEVGAFVVETIRNTDVQIPSRAYWKRIREICDKYGVLLILDEIPIAFGRTGHMFAFEHFEIEPDILCLGKGMGGGIIPMAGVITREKYNIAGHVSLGHYTHEKSPLGCTATMAVIEYINEWNILEKVRRDEIYVKEKLQKMSELFHFIGDVRGLGLLWGIEIVKDKIKREPDNQRAEYILYECLKQGLSFKVSTGNVLQLCPPLTITRNELDNAFGVLEAAFSNSIIHNSSNRIKKQ